MFIIGILQWWYGRGISWRLTRLKSKLMSTFDYFSIDLLAKTFFSPFRQISAGKANGPLGVQLRAWLDRLISRVIGAGVRFVMIIIGSVTLGLQAVLGVVMLVVWAVVPVAPVAGIVLFAMGWVPWNL